MKKVTDALFYAGVYVHVVLNQLIDRASDLYRRVRGK